MRYSSGWVGFNGSFLAVLGSHLRRMPDGIKCPCCHRLCLAVVATRPHPELGPEGIEQHDVRCSCGYEASRLYDPQDFLR